MSFHPKQKEIITITVIVFIAILLFGFWKFWSMTPDKKPEAVAGDFYSWYLEYEGNALLSGAYKKSGYLTSRFIDQIETQLNESKGLITQDPIFCKQSIPDRFFMTNPNIQKKSAQITLVQFFQEELHSAKIKLVHQFGKWKIDDIICPNAKQSQ